MIKNQYPCTQQELYSTGETAWNLFLLHIGDLSKLRRAYTTQFYEEQLLVIEKARNIKERPVLLSELKLMRRELIKAKDAALYHYLCLRQFVKNNYESDMAKTLISMMGSRHYVKAVNNNWESCENIISGCKHILIKNKEKLMLDDNMPPSFIDESMAAFKNYQDMKSKYRFFEKNIKYEGIKKVYLNNQIYRELTTMLKHAQLVYRKQPDMQSLFRFDKLLKTARSTKKQTTAGNKPQVVSFLSRVAAMF